MDGWIESTDAVRVRVRFKNWMDRLIASTIESVDRCGAACVCHPQTSTIQHRIVSYICVACFACSLTRQHMHDSHGYAFADERPGRFGVQAAHDEPVLAHVGWYVGSINWAGSIDRECGKVLVLAVEIHRSNGFAPSLARHTAKAKVHTWLRTLCAVLNQNPSQSHAQGHAPPPSQEGRIHAAESQGGQKEGGQEEEGPGPEPAVAGASPPPA